MYSIVRRGGIVMTCVASGCCSGLNVFGDQSSWLMISRVEVSWFMCVAKRGHLMAFGIKVALGI